MARDYAVKYKVPKRNNPANKWKWLVIFIVLILIGGWIFNKIYQTHKYKEENFEVISNKVDKVKEIKEMAKPVDISSSVVDEPQFDFYTILPKNSRNVSSNKFVQQGNNAQGILRIDETKNASHINSKNIKDDSDEIIIEKPKAYRYFLQVAAVKNILDANLRKDELALLGFKANIKEFKSKGNIWYRIVIGPYSSESKMKEEKMQLEVNKISSIVVKL